MTLDINRSNLTVGVVSTGALKSAGFAATG
jgi:hypothetical protein